MRRFKILYKFDLPYVKWCLISTTKKHNIEVSLRAAENLGLKTLEIKK